VEESRGKALIQAMLGMEERKRGGGEVEIICMANVHENLFRFVRELIVAGESAEEIQRTVDDEFKY
jgi:hypothetical protein